MHPFLFTSLEVGGITYIHTYYTYNVHNIPQYQATQRSIKKEKNYGCHLKKLMIRSISEN